MPWANSCNVLRMPWCQPEPIGSKKPMAIEGSAKGRSTEPAGFQPMSLYAALSQPFCPMPRSHDILQNVGLAQGLQHLQSGQDEQRVLSLSQPGEIVHDGVTLAWWAGVDGIVFSPVFSHMLQSIRQVELEGIMGL